MEHEIEEIFNFDLQQMKTAVDSKVIPVPQLDSFEEFDAWINDEMLQMLGEQHGVYESKFNEIVSGYETDHFLSERK